jgi:hypothetical protein
MTRALLEQALEALESVAGKGKRCESAITAISAHLAQPQGEQLERKPMPDNEMNDLAFQCGIQREDARDPSIEEFARAIEAFHGITEKP